MEGIIAQLANRYLVESPGLLLFSPEPKGKYVRLSIRDTITTAEVRLAPIHLFTFRNKSVRLVNSWLSHCLPWGINENF
jgi:hypothetical protein